MMPTVASPSDKLLQVRDICVTDYVDAMYSRFRSYIIPSITKSDASELIIQKQPFFQWFNCINQYECDTVAGIANIPPNLAAQNKYGLVGSFEDANQYHQAASRMTSIMKHYYPKTGHSTVPNRWLPLIF